MRILRSVILTPLLLLPLLTTAATCPLPKDLVLAQGVYSWFSIAPGWEGGFAGPTPGKGRSTKIDHFMKAHWIQLNNRADSLGYVVCDYKGNYDDESIRFTQTEIRKGNHEKQVMSKRPSNVNWDCKIMPEYPSEACTCSGVVGNCTFTSSAE